MVFRRRRTPDPAIEQLVADAHARMDRLDELTEARQSEARATRLEQARIRRETRDLSEMLMTPHWKLGDSS